ncbi:MAG: hypothetical protein OJF49_001766 [Ktedonobacterales bacterium]|jgi:hypothetical protein|nr:MAG: hypothetical protein OJF49_001766 [Ktedonobacterales bacterium]
MRTAYLTATRYTLLELARNRLAIGLLALFLPIWYVLLGEAVGTGDAEFKLKSTGTFVYVDAHTLTLLTAGFNAITLIIGFLIFASTRKGGDFDRRLVLSGLSQPVMVLAKLSALVVTAAAVSLYAVLILLVFWRPENLALVWMGLFSAALIYGTFGMLLGVLVRSELAGFFIIIMVSLLDTLFQNPVDNPAANKDFLAWFPSFGPTQLAVAGGYLNTMSGRMLALSLAWFVGFGVLALLIFWRRTRAWNARGRAQQRAG